MTELPDPQLPFFAYGMYKPGEIAFSQIRDFVADVQEDEVSGYIKVRDGIPVLIESNDSKIPGSILCFTPNLAKHAYDKILELEPKHQYRWKILRTIKGNSVNGLVTRQPGRGNAYDIIELWSSWNDPLFTEALEVVDETLHSEEVMRGDGFGSLKPQFRLQMAYLLLWTSIERFLYLRYGTGSDVVQNINRLSKEPAFVDALPRYIKPSSSGGKSRFREIYRTDDPGQQKIQLDPFNPKKSVDYYYQVRCNVAHRGKTAPGRDFEILAKSTESGLSSGTTWFYISR